MNQFSSNGIISRMAEISEVIALRNEHLMSSMAAISNTNHTLFEQINKTAINAIRSSIESNNGLSLQKISELSEALIKQQKDYNANISTAYKTDLNQSIKFTHDDEIAIGEILNTAVSQPENWQIKLENLWNIFRTRNPVVAAILIHMILPIFLVLIFSNQDCAETRRNTELRSLPASNAPALNIVVEKQIVFINKTAPYWCEIKYTDEETGEEYCGWVSKRSIKVIEWSELSALLDDTAGYKSYD